MMEFLAAACLTIVGVGSLGLAAFLLVLKWVVSEDDTTEDAWGEEL